MRVMLLFLLVVSGSGVYASQHTVLFSLSTEIDKSALFANKITKVFFSPEKLMLNYQQVDNAFADITTLMRVETDVAKSDTDIYLSYRLITNNQMCVRINPPATAGGNWIEQTDNVEIISKLRITNSADSVTTDNDDLLEGPVALPFSGTYQQGHDEFKIAENQLILSFKPLAEYTISCSGELTVSVGLDI